MNDTPSPTQPPRMAKIQAELVDLSTRLNALAHDFQQLAAELPQQVGVSNAPAAPLVVPSPPPAGPRGEMPPQSFAGSQPGRAPLPPGAYPPPPPSARPSPPPAGYPPPPPAARPAMPTTAPPVFTPAPRPPARPRRQVSIAEIFAVVGSAITLLGVAFVLLLPDQEVMPDLARAGIGLGLAAVAAAVALLQHRREPSNIGSQALMATGIASAFLTVLALSTLFRGPSGEPLVPAVVGTVVGGLISLGGITVARWWRSEWLAVLAVLGALVLAPYLAGREPLWPMTFMLVMTAVTAAFQHKVDWVGLLLARFLPTSLYFLWVLAVSVGELDRQWGLLLTFLLAAVGVGIATQHQFGSPRMQATSVAALVTMSAPLALATWGQPDRLLSSELGAAFGLMMVAVGLLPKLFERHVRATAVPLGALFVVLAVVRFNEGHYLGYLFFTLAAAYLAVAAATKHRPTQVVGFILAVIGVVVWLPVVRYAFRPLPGSDLEVTAQSVLGLITVVMAVRALRAAGVERVRLVYASWLAAVIFVSMAMITGGMLIAQRVGVEVSQGFQTAHALVTVAWILASVWLLRRGLRHEQDSAAAVRIAIALSAAAVAKLFFFDLRTLPDLVRALAFLAVGVLMLVIGTWYHKQLERGRRENATPVAARGSDETAGAPISAPVPAPDGAARAASESGAPPEA